MVEVRLDNAQPEDGEGLVVAGGFSVCSANGLVEAANGDADLREDLGGAGLEEVTCGYGDVAGVGELLFGESAGGEGGEKMVEILF